jgi:Zn-dependent protease with chaperone function
VNVVTEMALAAAVPAPQVLVTESDAVNAAVFGRSDGEATIVFTTGLLASVNRAEMQAIAAHLVGSIADGDMAIGTRIATMMSLFGLVTRLSASFGDREAAKRLVKLLRAAFRRGSSTADAELAVELTNPFEDAPGAKRDETPEYQSDKIPWRTLAWMPLTGPLVISGFFGGFVSTLLLGPLLAMAWRRRKYMADASAVRLTRDPDALATALQKLRGKAVKGAFNAVVSHLSVVPDTGPRSRTLLSGSAVPMAPSYDRRLRALRKMGASIAEPVRGPKNVLIWLLASPLFALVIGLLCVAMFLLIYVSIALSGLFTWFPVVLVHAILR